VNEVVVPLQFKNAFNGSKPEGDAQFLPKVQEPELPKLIESIYKMPAPATPRDDLVSVFLTGVDGLNKPANGTPSEQLRLNMSIAPAANPNRLGVIGGDNSGFPNGRRLADDVIDIALQVVMGELKNSPNDLGDAVDANDLDFVSAFPYVALPHSGSDVATTEVADPAASTNAPTGNAAATTADDDDDSDTSWPLVALGVGVGCVVGAGGVALLRRRKVSA
jgi:hypothetical protein